MMLFQQLESSESLFSPLVKGSLRIAEVGKPQSFDQWFWQQLQIGLPLDHAHQ